MQILGTVFNLKRNIKHSNTVEGRVEQVHLFKKNKIKLQEIRSVGHSGSERTWSERIFVTKTISASQEPDTPGSPNPYDRHNASVSQTTRSTGTQEGRYRPTRSKTFIDRPQTAKREKEELKTKSVDFSTVHQRAYIVVNLRKNSNQIVEIG